MPITPPAAASCAVTSSLPASATQLELLRIRRHGIRRRGELGGLTVGGDDDGDHSLLSRHCAGRRRLVALRPFRTWQDRASAYS